MDRIDRFFWQVSNIEKYLISSKIKNNISVEEIGRGLIPIVKRT